MRERGGERGWQGGVAGGRLDGGFDGEDGRWAFLRCTDRRRWVFLGSARGLGWGARGRGLFWRMRGSGSGWFLIRVIDFLGLDEFAGSLPFTPFGFLIYTELCK
jgi:hypothetical protein